jgi:hypothetical protein
MEHCRVLSPVMKASGLAAELGLQGLEASSLSQDGVPGKAAMRCHFHPSDGQSPTTPVQMKLEGVGV